MSPEAAAGGSGDSPLPCLNKNNSDRVPQNAEQKRSKSRQKKVAFSLQENVRHFADRYGLERLGFLTLTFADHVLDPKEASRRFNNLARRVLKRYDDWLRVYERQKSGRVHYHLLVVLPHDIRTGVNFEAFSNGNYGSAGAKLRSEWAFWRNTAPRYGFGRTELLPIRSNADGIGKYVGKYIAKHMDQRKEADKGVRLVSYSRAAGKKVSCNFDWNSAGAQLWRAKLGMFARSVGATADDYSVKFKEWYGSRWAWHLRPFIEAIRLPVYQTGRHFCIDHPLWWTDPGFCSLEGGPEAAVDVSLKDQREVFESVANAYRFAASLRAINETKQRRPAGGRTEGVEGPTGPAKPPSPFGRYAPCAPALKSNCLARDRFDYIGAICR